MDRTHPINPPHLPFRIPRSRGERDGVRVLPIYGMTSNNFLRCSLSLAWVSVAIFISCSTVYAGLLEDQRRLQNIQEKRALQIYGEQNKGVLETQRRAQSDILYRQSVYFSPKDVNIFRPAEMNRAIQTDLAQRQSKFESLQSDLHQKISQFSDRLQTEVNQLIDTERGEYRTRNKDHFSHGSDNLKQLSNEISQFSRQIEQTSAPQIQNLLTLPYLDRQQEKDGIQNARDFVSKTIQGNDGTGGVLGLRSSAISWSGQLQTISNEIRKQEDEMKDGFLSSYIWSGVQMIGGVMLAPATGGSSLTLIGNAVKDLAMTARQNIVLNMKGLDGFRSQNENSTAQNYQHFQTAVNTAETLAGIVSLVQTGFKQGARAAGSKGNFYLNTSQKYQLLTSAYKLSDLSSLSSKLMNDEQKTIVNSGLSGINLVLTGMQMYKNNLSVKGIKTDTPHLYSDRQAFLIDSYLQSANSLLRNGLQVAQSWDEGRRWTKENSSVLTLASMGTQVLGNASTRYKFHTFEKNYKPAQEEIRDILLRDYKNLPENRKADLTSLESETELQLVKTMLTNSLTKCKVINLKEDNTLVVNRPLTAVEGTPNLLQLAANSKKLFEPNVQARRIEIDPAGFRSSNRTEFFVTVESEKEFKKIIKSKGRWTEDINENSLILSPQGKKVPIQEYSRIQYQKYEDRPKGYSEVRINGIGMIEPNVWKIVHAVPLQEFETKYGKITIQNGLLCIPKNMPAAEQVEWYQNQTKSGMKLNLPNINDKR